MKSLPVAIASFVAFLLGAAFMGYEGRAAQTPHAQAAGLYAQPRMSGEQVWQLVYDSIYVGATTPNTIGFYSDMNSCEAVRNVLNSAHTSRHAFCAQVRLP